MITTAAYCTSTSYKIEVAFFSRCQTLDIFHGNRKKYADLLWVVINTGKKHSNVIQRVWSLMNCKTS